jgi:hypothetical protein
MSTPFWRPALKTAEGPPSFPANNAEGPPVVTAEDGAGAWEKPLVDGRALPGLVRMVKEPDLELAENFSKPKDRDAYVRKVLALKAPEFAFECTLLTPEHLRDYEEQKPRLLPVYKADGRAEVRAITDPLVNLQEIHYAIVTKLKPDRPKEGGPLRITVWFRAFFPQPPKGTDKTLEQKQRTDGSPVPTVDLAQTTPTVPRLADVPRSGRLQ